MLLLACPVVSAVYSWRCLIRHPYNWKIFLVLYMYGIFVLAYVLVPAYTNDLTRYFDILDSIKGMSLIGAVTRLKNGLYVENFLFWLVSVTGDNHILPAVSTSVVYGISAYTLLDYAEREHCLEDAWIVLLFEVLQFSFFSVANNVRNIFTFSIVVLAVYRELVLKKRDLLTLVLYIAPCFMHKTGAVLVALRVLVIFVRKALPLVIGFVLLLPSAIIFVYQRRSSIPIGGVPGRLIRKIVSSAYNYLKGGTEYADIVSGSKGQLVIRLIVMAMILLIAVICYLYNREHPSDYNVFCILLCAVVVACNTFQTPAYWRFAMAAIMTSAPSMLWALRQRVRIIRTMLCLLALMAVFRFVLDLAFTRLRMDHLDFVLAAVRTNIFTIAANILHYML